MDQIYYTQCPMGYGWGISNGFQVKRISGEYPKDADFRLFAFRPYPAGGRTLAPETLRYRLDGDVADVACLAPRTSEYETERGLWGRPGGLFVHGVRLRPEERTELRNWFAGLAGAPSWVRSDVQPSRQAGMQPPPMTLGPKDFRLAPCFATVAPLAEGLEAGLLARILAALAEAARTGGTVHLIDAPEKLAERVALLTFAFPASLRGDLTFSTYHDRPEELPWFRLQGTSSTARPNRAALVSQGRIVDVAAGVCEPEMAPPPWAERLAGWFARRSAEDAAAWEAVDAVPLPDGNRWDEAELDALFLHHAETLNGPDRPTSADDWLRLARRADWVRRHDRASAWSPKVGPDWWRDNVGAPGPEARAALAAVLAAPEAWPAAEWGVTAAGLWRDASLDERDDGILELVGRAPTHDRAGFLRTVIAALPENSTRSLFRRLREGSADPGLLLPLEAPSTLRRAIETGDFDPINRLIVAAIRARGTLPAVLDSLAAEAAGLGCVPRVAAALDPLFLRNGEALNWALRLGDEGRTWVEPSFRTRLFAGEADRASWRTIRDKADESRRGTLARWFLQLSAASDAPSDAFRWGIEELLLRVPAAERPSDPTWAGLYLARIESDLDVFDRIVRPKPENEPSRKWLSTSPIDPDGRARLERLRSLFLAMKSGRAADLAACDLASIPRSDRPRLLGRLLDRTADDPRPVLEAARDAWPELTRIGRPTRPDFASEFAAWGWIAGAADAPSLWLDRVRWLVEVLGGGSSEHGPEGWFALTLAATSARAEVENREPPWGLRRWVFQSPNLPLAIAADLRGELLRGKVEEAAGIVGEWDRRIEKPHRADAFWEVVLNSCDGSRLAAVALAHVREFQGFVRLRWWDGAARGEAIPEMREGFAASIPMAPLPSGGGAKLNPWLLRAGPIRGGATIHDPLPADPEVPASASLSALRRDRWACVESLTGFAAGASDWGRTLRDWALNVDAPPLGSTSTADRAAFLEGVLRALPNAGRDELYDVAGRVLGLGFASAALLRSIARDGSPDAKIVARTIEDRLHGKMESAKGAHQAMSRRASEIRGRIARLEREFAEPAGTARHEEIDTQLHYARRELAVAQEAEAEAAARLDAAMNWLTADRGGLPE